eukprot:6927966-Pyramimonas_sp.AAC.1
MLVVRDRPATRSRARPTSTTPAPRGPRAARRAAAGRRPARSSACPRWASGQTPDCVTTCRGPRRFRTGALRADR